VFITTRQTTGLVNLILASQMFWKNRQNWQNWPKPQEFMDNDSDSDYELHFSYLFLFDVFFWLSLQNVTALIPILTTVFDKNSKHEIFNNLFLWIHWGDFDAFFFVGSEKNWNKLKLYYWKCIQMHFLRNFVWKWKNFYLKVRY
jgi:hypothetical protein